MSQVPTYSSMPTTRWTGSPGARRPFEKAKAEDKPVFLSIGYSSCHWCHVMAHECFEDDEVASLMNDTFVNVKVDREELPHIDHIYMQACQVLTGSGGWPLTIVMTPEKEPFFAATYLPKHSRSGLMGMMDLVSATRNPLERQEGPGHQRGCRDYSDGQAFRHCTDRAGHEPEAPRSGL